MEKKEEPRKEGAKKEEAPREEPKKKTTQQREEEELRLSKFGAHEKAEEAIASLPEKEWVSFLRIVHDSIADSYEEELDKRVQENTELLDELLTANSKPPYSAEIVEAVINICKARVMGEVLPQMDEVLKNLRQKLKPMKIDSMNATMALNMAIANISMEYNQHLQKDLEEELKSRDFKLEEFMSVAYPILTSDFGFFQDLLHIHSLKMKETMPKDGLTIERATKYIRLSNEHNRKLLAGKINPQAVLFYPNLCEVFLFNETGIEFIQVETFVVDFLNRLPAPPAALAESDAAFLRLLLEEVFLCQKVQEVVVATGQAQMQMMQDLGEKGGFGGPGGPGGLPPMSEEQMEQMSQMFNPQNMEAMKEMFANMDMDKLMAQMPDMQQFMGAMMDQEQPPFPTGQKSNKPRKKH